MKAKYILVSLLMVALVMTGTGYSVNAGSGDKITGGGRFTNISGVSPYVGDKVSFNLQTYLLDDGAADGKFQLINHDEKMKLSGSFTSYSVSGYGVMLVGSIDGGASQPLYVLILESAEPGFDKIDIWIGKTPPTKPTTGMDYKGQVGKGNIQWHKAKVK